MERANTRKRRKKKKIKWPIYQQKVNDITDILTIVDISQKSLNTFPFGVSFFSSIEFISLHSLSTPLFYFIVRVCYTRELYRRGAYL